jgi:hypothetical protein
MKKSELIDLIREEIIRELTKNEVTESLNEVYDLDKAVYSPNIRKQVDKLVSVIEKSPNLNKVAVASILNDIILALGLNRTQTTLYMNMIKQSRSKYNF